jgi:hypothetical protein
MQKNHLFTTLFVSLSIALISFAKVTGNSTVTAAGKVVVADTIEAVDSVADVSLSTSLYEGLNLQAVGLSKEAVEYAVKGYEKLVAAGTVANSQYLTIIDFSQSSRKKRFYLIDVKNGELVMNTFVSHGKNTGVDNAEKFSNTVNSEQSSLGFYVTGATYTGKHGKSLRLAGQEQGFNNNAMARGVVVHGAAYVNAGRVKSAYMGRSQGCPALPETEYAKAIDYIKDGSVMFIYHPTAAGYIQQSPVLNG